MITKETVEKLYVKEEWITVIFDEYERGNWASNVKLYAIKFGEGFGLMGTDKTK